MDWSGRRTGHGDFAGETVESDLACQDGIRSSLADGKTVKEVGELLYISPKTVESRKYNIMEKLNVHTIADLTKISIKKNLIKVKAGCFEHAV